MTEIKGNFLTYKNTKKRNSTSAFPFVLLFIVLFFGLEVKAQSISIWQTYAIVNVNGGGNTYYDLLASTGNPDFNGANLGTFTNSQSIIIAGGESRTNKCSGGNVTGSTIYYNVHLASLGAGGFSGIGLNFASNDGGTCNGDQTWRSSSNATNILAGLAPGNYTLEIYSEAAGFPGTVYATNGGANYKATFKVVNSWTGTTSTNWNTASNWSSSVIPNSTTDVIIPSSTPYSPSISQTTNAVANSITINSGATVSMSNSYVLTISNGGFFTCNGNFNAGNGMVTFAGLGNVSGTFSFNDVTLNNGVTFSATATIVGKLILNANGYVNITAPKYGSSSTIVYNSGGVYDSRVEWSSTTPGSSGYPNNILVQNGTNVNLAQYAGIDRAIAGNLNIGLVGTASTGTITMVNTTYDLIIGGNIVIGGTTSGANVLELSSTSGSDLYVSGNWDTKTNGAVTLKTRAVFFQGTGSSTITTLSGNSFDYLFINKTANTTFLANSVGINYNLNVSSGVFDIGAFSINRNLIGGVLTVSNGARFKIGGTSSFPLNYTTHTIGTTSTVEYSGTNQTASILNNAVEYGNLSFSGNGTKLLQGSGVDVANDLDIANNINTILNVTGTQTLKVTNQFINNGGIANFDDNSSLVQINSIANIGNIKYKRIATIRLNDYVYWSSPVENFSLSAVSPSTPASKIYKWLPTINNNYGNWSGASGVMNKGQGYIIRGPSGFNTTAQDFTATFNNVPINGNFTYTISRGNYTSANYINSISGETVTKFDDNWNLIGNPYPSSINAIAFLTDNTNIEGSIALWTHGTLPNLSEPNPFYNSFTYNYTVRDYITYNKLGASTGPGTFNGYIAAGQGFFINMNDGAATSQTINFKNSFRSKTYNNSQFYRNSNRNMPDSITDRHRIWLDIINTSGTSVRTLVGYCIGSTSDKDRMFDAYTKVDGTLNLFSFIGDEDQVIQGRQLPFVTSDVIPLGISIPTSGNYKIVIAAVDGLFANNGQVIYLRDKYLNTITNISENPYDFSQTTGIFRDRFEIVYDTTLSSPTNIENSNEVFVYQNENTIHINSKTLINSVQLFDCTGRLLESTNAVLSNDASLILNSVQSQMLLIKISDTNGFTTIKKFIYK
jgi:hypothetical protein